jgi:hypothetical protein
MGLFLDGLESKLAHFMSIEWDVEDVFTWRVLGYSAIEILVVGVKGTPFSKE